MLLSAGTNTSGAVDRINPWVDTSTAALPEFSTVAVLREQAEMKPCLMVDDSIFIRKIARDIPAEMDARIVAAEDDDARAK